MPQMSKVNWNTLRTEYITSLDPVSYEDLAKKYHLNPTTVAERAGPEGWVAKRKKSLIKTQEKTLEIATDKIAAFQVEKLKVGKYMVGVGAKGIQDHLPKNARESKELIESGYKIATEAMGLDKPATQVNTQINNFIPILGWDTKIT